MRRLLDFARRAARREGSEIRARGNDVYELVRPGQQPVFFTTDRDKALQSEDLNLLGIEHPLVKQWLERMAALPPEERAIIGYLEDNRDGPGLVTVWEVTVHAPGGQVRRQIVRLAMRSNGERSAYLERSAREVFNVKPAETGATVGPSRLMSLVNGTASEILHRQLAYSGMLPEGASYTSRLVACVEVAG